MKLLIIVLLAIVAYFIISRYKYAFADLAGTRAKKDLVPAGYEEFAGEDVLIRGLFDFLSPKTKIAGTGFTRIVEEFGY